jgi:hypothetical protein
VKYCSGDEGEYVTPVMQKRSEYKALVEKIEGIRTLGRSRCREGNINTELQVIG